MSRINMRRASASLLMTWAIATPAVLGQATWPPANKPAASGLNAKADAPPVGEDKPSTARPAATKPGTEGTANRTATRPASARAPDPVRDAVVALFREGTDAAKSNKPFPRPDFDYLAGRTDVQQADIVKALGQQQSGNPRVDAYVKLNLLSAVPSTFSEENALAATRAYVLSGQSLRKLPSVDLHERQDWDRKVGQVNSADQVAQANAEFERATQAILDDDKIVIRYRDELRSKLASTDGPTMVKIFAAQLEDLSQRAQLGYETDDDLAALKKQIDKWAKKADRKDLATLARATSEYKYLTKAPTVYTKLSWSASSRKARWGSRAAALSASKLEAIIKDLEERDNGH